MSIRFEYENSPALHRQTVAAITKHAGITKRFWLMVWAVPFFMTISVALTPANRESVGRFVTAVIPWWVVYPLLFVVLMKWSIARTAKRRLADDATQQGRQERTLDDGGLSLKNAAMSAHVGWNAITRSIETPEFFLLFQNRDCAYALPKDALAPQDIPQARVLLRDKLADRAQLLH